MTSPLAELYVSYDELLALYNDALRQRPVRGRPKRKRKSLCRKQDAGQVKLISEWAALYQSRRRQR